MRLQGRSPRPLAYPRTALFSVRLSRGGSAPDRGSACPAPPHVTRWDVCHRGCSARVALGLLVWFGLFIWVFWLVGFCLWVVLFLFCFFLLEACPGAAALSRGGSSRELGGDAPESASFSGRAWLFLLPGAAGLGGGKGKSCFCHLSRESLLHKGVRDIWKKRGTSTQSCARRTRGAALMFFLNCSTFKRGQFRYILICYTVLN